MDHSKKFFYPNLRNIIQCVNTVFTIVIYTINTTLQHLQVAMDILNKMNGIAMDKCIGFNGNFIMKPALSLCYMSMLLCWFSCIYCFYIVEKDMVRVHTNVVVMVEVIKDMKVHMMDMMTVHMVDMVAVHRKDVMLVRMVNVHMEEAVYMKEEDAGTPADVDEWYEKDGDGNDENKRVNDVEKEVVDEKHSDANEDNGVNDKKKDSVEDSDDVLKVNKDLIKVNKDVVKASKDVG